MTAAALIGMQMPTCGAGARWRKEAIRLMVFGMVAGLTLARLGA